jgi:hypothetical protein
MLSNNPQIVYDGTAAELLGLPAFAALPKFNAPQLPDFLQPPTGLRYY